MFDRAATFLRRGDLVKRAAPRRSSRSNLSVFLGVRPFQEARLRAYLVRQHRAGRPLSDILEDAYVRRCGSENFCWRVLRDPRTIAALEHSIREAIEDCRPNG